LMTWAKALIGSSIFYLLSLWAKTALGQTQCR
jgi:hypothetical protein